ncbi:MAG: IS1634 family transposase [Candidatus Thorarchaeota archaeon]
MYLRSKKRRGHDYYSVVEGTRCADKVKQKKILNIGRLDKLTPEKIQDIEKKISELNEPALIDKYWQIIFKMGYSIHDLVNIRRALNYGDVAAFYKIAEMLDMPNIISEIIPKGGGPEIGKIVTIMAICQSLAPTSKRDLRNWYEETALESITEIQPENTEEWNLYSAMKYLTKERIEKIENRLVLKLVNDYNINMDTCLYDLTSTFFYGHKDMLKLYGYSRDHMSHLVQVVIGLAVTKEDGFPIKHWVHPGNTNDMSALPSSAANMKQLYGGDNKITLVFDRGNISEKNVRILDDMGFDYICGLKRNEKNVKNIIRKSIEGGSFEIIKTIKDDEGKETDVSVTSVNVDLWDRNRKVVVVYSEALKDNEERSRTKSVNGAKEELMRIEKKCNDKNISHDNLVIMLHEALKGTAKYFDIQIMDIPSQTQLTIDKTDESKKMDQRIFRWIDPKIDDLTSRIHDMKIEEARSELKEILGNKKKHYRYRLSTTVEHSTFKWKLKSDVVERTSEFDGYYALMSTDITLSMVDIIETNDSRDIAEKAFQTLKNPLKIRPIRHWVPEMVRAHIYICLLGYLLRQMLKYLLRKGNVDLSIREALIELRRVKLVQMGMRSQNSRFKLTHLSDDQKKLFDLIGLDQSVNELSI